MSDRALSVTVAAGLLSPYISRQGLYDWIRRGDIKGEQGPGGRWIVRESEVARILAWYEGADPETVQATLDAD